MSRADKPWALNRLMRFLSVLNGEGMTPELAAEKPAFLESRLPSFTLHLGPPDYSNKSKGVNTNLDED